MGLVDMNENDYVDDESCESVDNDEPDWTPDSCTTNSLDEQSSACETDIPFEHDEWLVFDSTLGRHRSPRLLEFLRLLLDKTHYASYASYTNLSIGMFTIHKPNEVAALWEKVKSRQSNHTMTYDKFARAIRWYYKLGIMVKTNARYTFQFGPGILLLDQNMNHSSS
ncbi:unnamed protein product [Rotaria sp. Silwood1]|nr:unnamed protein product [Rotaria sp. Silwood1]CAF3346303.1 unnamed protein product [Rotaria sp. Silwood1]CAF3409884.1 unnamed protein product [Rotaria sp. Silwood1]CAF4544067.1 unnamed protein product [Rotaria sp. Silwood1]CAF4565000.1 unnamed protein product [Rotaria sp. Silwood1]